VPNFSVFDRPLRGLNNNTVALKVLGYIVPPLREANVGNCAKYENDDKRTDANQFEPFFNVSLPWRFLGFSYITPCERG
jgi:hypothetical protein